MTSQRVVNAVVGVGLVVLLGASRVSAQASSEEPAGGPVIEVPAIDPSQDASAQRIGSADPTTLGGYGELVFTAVEDGDNAIDLHRFILFVAHRFNDWITFYAEVEIEHVHEVEMEQARLELRVLDELTVVAGLVLVPIGLTNLYHEPPLFHGANRPQVDRVIFPSTWREAALGLVYRPTEWLTIEAYVMSALNAAGFSSSSGLRGGRQAVSEALANDLAGALRVSVEPVLGLGLALSGYYGGADQDQLGDLEVTVSAVGFDAWYRNFGVEARAQLATVFISETEALSAALEDTIGEVLLGWYVELGYDVLRSLDTTHQLVPFARYEAFDTHASVVEGLTESAALERSDLTFGLSYRPIPTVVFKFDYQLRESAADEGVPDQWDLGLGWMF